MAHRLNNYVRTFRKRCGLSQEEVAFLLGCHCGTKVSRYERFARVPTLRSAMALAVVLQTPVCDLFAGIHDTVLRETLMRVRTLCRRLEVSSDPAARKKLRLLQVLLACAVETSRSPS